MSRGRLPRPPGQCACPGIGRPVCRSLPISTCQAATRSPATWSMTVLKQPSGPIPVLNPASRTTEPVILERDLMDEGVPGAAFRTGDAAPDRGPLAAVGDDDDAAVGHESHGAVPEDAAFVVNESR